LAFEEYKLPEWQSYVDKQNAEGEAEGFLNDAEWNLFLDDQKNYPETYNTSIQGTWDDFLKDFNEKYGESAYVGPSLLDYVGEFTEIPKGPQPIFEDYWGEDSLFQPEEWESWQTANNSWVNDPPEKQAQFNSTNWDKFDTEYMDWMNYWNRNNEGRTLRWTGDIDGATGGLEPIPTVETPNTETPNNEETTTPPIGGGATSSGDPVPKKNIRGQTTNYVNPRGFKGKTQSY